MISRDQLAKLEERLDKLEEFKDTVIGRGIFQSEIANTDRIQILSNKALKTPVIDDFTNATHAHSGTSAGGAIAPAIEPWVDVRAYTTLALANTAAYDNGKTLLITKECTLPANTTLTAAVKVIKGGSFTKASTYTLTINGPFEAGLYTVFSGFSSGDVTFGAGSVKEVYPQWWGAIGDGTTDSTNAINYALVAAGSGGRVFLPKGIYIISAPILLPNGTLLLGTSEAGGIGSELKIKASTTIAQMVRPTAIDGTQEYTYVRNVALNGNAGASGAVSGAMLDLLGCANNSYAKDMVIWNYGGAPGIRVTPGESIDGFGSIYIQNTWVLGAEVSGAKGIYVSSKYETAIERQSGGLVLDTVMIEGISDAYALHFETFTNNYIRQCWFHNVWLQNKGTEEALKLDGIYSSSFEDFRVYSEVSIPVLIGNTATKLNYGNVFINFSDYSPSGFTNMIQDDMTGYLSPPNVGIYTQGNDTTEESSIGRVEFPSEATTTKFALGSKTGIPRIDNVGGFFRIIAADDGLASLSAANILASSLSGAVATSAGGTDLVFTNEGTWRGTTAKTSGSSADRMIRFTMAGINYWVPAFSAVASG